MTGRSELGYISGSSSSLTQYNNNLGIHINGSLDSTGSKRLSGRQVATFGNSGIAYALKEGIVIARTFGFATDAGHDLDGLLKVRSIGRFSRKHDTVTSIVNGIGDIGTFGASGAGIADHGFQHLGGSNDGLSGNVGLANHHLLGKEDLGRRDFHLQKKDRHG
jgi:hypothetical protein